jgi:hypothetical protein
MNTTNNFKQMMEEDEIRYPLPPDIETNVLGSLNILAMMGQAIELYIPKVFEMFIMTLGGTIKEIEETHSQELIGGGLGVDADEQHPGIAG